MGKRKSDYAEILHNLTKRHWIWYTILLALPTIWFTFVLPIFGKTIGMKTAEGDFSLVGKIISVVVILISLIISGLNNRYASKSEFGKLEKLKGNIQYLEKIIDSFDFICDEKSTQIRRIIAQIKAGKKDAPDIITNPSNQLRRILEQIGACLVKFMERPDEHYAFRDFDIKLAYRFPQENTKWVWLDGTMEGGTSLDELAAEKCKSTLNYMIESKKTYYFNNRKEDAKKEERYIFNSTDETNDVNNKAVGSIFCYSYKIKQGNDTYVDAILFVSTHEKRFADEEKTDRVQNVKDNLISLAKDYFGRRINIELSLLYLDYVKMKYSKECDGEVLE